MKYFTYWAAGLRCASHRVSNKTALSQYKMSSRPSCLSLLFPIQVFLSVPKRASPLFDHLNLLCLLSSSTYLPLKHHKIVMASAPNTAVFLIFHRDKNGTSDCIFSYEEEEATYLLVAINICRELLNHEKARQALKAMADAYIRTNPGSWNSKIWTLDAIATKYIDLIFDTFPWLFSDDGFPNPNVSACHYRRKYDKFYTRVQGICLNGSVS